MDGGAGPARSQHLQRAARDLLVRAAALLPARRSRPAPAPADGALSPSQLGRARASARAVALPPRSAARLDLFPAALACLPLHAARRASGRCVATLGDVSRKSRQGIISSRCRFPLSPSSAPICVLPGPKLCCPPCARTFALSAITLLRQPTCVLWSRPTPTVTARWSARAPWS